MKIDIAALYPVIMFDWGDTIMKDRPDLKTAMYLWPVVEAVDGAAELLGHLFAQKKTIILATGATESDETAIGRALERVNLDTFFHRIYCFKNTGYRKSSEEFYRHILSDLGAKANEVVMIGDSFENDVAVPNHVGIHTLWLNQLGNEDRSGDLYDTIHTLRDLLPNETHLSH